MLFTVGGGKVTGINRVWIEKGHGETPHPHAEIEAKYPDEAKPTVLSDACSYLDLRADGGSVEIANTMKIHLAPGLAPIGVGL